jgi:taurine dioxygenase
VFPNQVLSAADIERFTLSFGNFGDDPFFSPIEENSHIAAISRGANETTPLFAENWHTDLPIRLTAFTVTSMRKMLGVA